MRRLTILALLFLLFAVPGSGQVSADEYAGLQFFYRIYPRENRTQLDFSPNTPLVLPAAFNVTFEIDFRYPPSFGEVFHVTQKENDCALVFTHFKDTATAFLELVVNRSASPLQIPISKKSITRNHWRRIELSFNNVAHTVTLKMDDREYGSAQWRIDPSNGVTMVAGCPDWLFGSMYDVPNMAVRNVMISDGEKRILHHWPLHEYSGTVGRDLAGGTNAVIRNPQWVSREHFSWARIASFHFEEEGAAAIYDSTQGRFLILGIKEARQIDIATNTISPFPYDNQRPKTAGQGFFDAKKKRIALWYPGQGEVTTFDEISRRWSPISTEHDTESHYFGAPPFINPYTDDYVMFGGYGWYTFKNCFRRYDIPSRRWVEIPATGDRIPPRSSAALGTGSQAGVIFLYGGEGNESGKQELGVRRFNDLYRVDLSTMGVRRMWSAPLKENFPGSTNMMMCAGPDTSTMYALMIRGSWGEPVFSTLFRIRLSRPEVSPIGNELPGNASPMIYDRATGQLAATVWHGQKAPFTSEMGIYVIAYPPIDSTDYAALVGVPPSPRTMSYPIIFATTFVLLTAGTAGYFWMAKRAARRGASLKPEKKPNENHGQNASPLHPEAGPVLAEARSIKLFGSVALYDDLGVDRSAGLTDTLMKVFLYLMINDLQADVDQLSEAVWPEMPQEQQRNARNTALARLRKFFAEFSDITVTVKTNTALLSLPNSWSCDYQLMRQLAKKPSFESADGRQTVRIMSKGKFAGGKSYQWLDDARLSLEEALVQRLSRLMRQLQTRQEWGEISEYGGCVLALDETNEPIMALTVEALSRLGRLEQARIVYDKFSGNYASIVGKTYPRTLSSIIAT